MSRSTGSTMQTLWSRPDGQPLGRLTGLAEAAPNNGTVWTATFTANSAVDLSGLQFTVGHSGGVADQFDNTNIGTGNTYDSFEIDTVAPTVTVSLSNSVIKAGDTVTVTLNASEPLIGLGTASDELHVPNLTSAGSATSNGEGTVWTKTYTADADVDDPTNEPCSRARRLMSPLTPMS